MDKMEITKGLSDLEVTKWSGVQSIDNLNLLQQPALSIHFRNTEAEMSRTITSCFQDSLTRAGQVMDQVSSSAEAAHRRNKTLSTLSVTHIPLACLQMFVPPPVCVFVLMHSLP